MFKEIFGWDWDFSSESETIAERICGHVESANIWNVRTLEKIVLLKTIKEKISGLEDSLGENIQNEAWRHKGREITAEKVDAGDALIIGSLEGGEREWGRSNLWIDNDG